MINQHEGPGAWMRCVLKLAYIFLLPLSSLHFKQSADQNERQIIYGIIISEFVNCTADEIFTC